MLPEVERFIIQRMSHQDLDQVARLEKLSFSDPWSKRSFEDELTNRFSIPLVVKSGTRIVGYACLWHIYEQMEIANIAVSPEFRGKGVGSTMMKRVLEVAKEKGCRSIILSVRQSNSAAISLYRRFGFVELERKKRYYRLPSEDGIIMIKGI
jgi:ribosomal-protein-alanine N-acetyltransferase